MGKFSAVGKAAAKGKSAARKAAGKAAGAGSKGAGKVSKGLDKAIAKRNAGRKARFEKPYGGPSKASKAKAAAAPKVAAVKAAPGKAKSSASKTKDVLGNKAARSAVAGNTKAKASAAATGGAMRAERGGQKVSTGVRKAANTPKNLMATRVQNGKSALPKPKKTIAAAAGAGGYVTYKRRTKSGKVVTVRRKRG